MKAFRKVNDVIGRIYMAFSVVGLCVAFAALVCHVVLRYVFKSGLQWSDELARYIQIWLVMLLAGVLVSDDSHIRITMVEEIFPVLVKPFKILRCLIIAVVAVALVVFIPEMLGVASHSVSSNLHLPMNILYYCFPLTGLLMLLNSIFNLIGVFLPEKSIEGGNVK